MARRNYSRADVDHSAPQARLFTSWTGRPAKIAVNSEDLFPFDLPTVLYPGGGLLRTYYSSSKKVPGEYEADQQTSLYVHCSKIQGEDDAIPVARKNLVERAWDAFVGNQEDGRMCRCGHSFGDHDHPLPRQLATVYHTKPQETGWHVTKPIEIEWEDNAAFLGLVQQIEEDRGDGMITEIDMSRDRVRGNAKGAWLLGLDDRTAAIIRPSGGVYVIYGGSFKVDGRGLID